MNIYNLGFTETNDPSLFAVELYDTLVFVAKMIYEYAVMFFDWLISLFAEDTAPPEEEQVRNIIQYTDMNDLDKTRLKLQYVRWKCFGEAYGCTNPFPPIADAWNGACKDPFKFLATAAKNPKYKESLKKFLFTEKHINEFMGGYSIDNIELKGFYQAMDDYAQTHKQGLPEIKKKFITDSTPANKINQIFGGKYWQKLVEVTINTVD